MPLKALVFDVDGTLAETEDAHRVAFNRTFQEFGLGWSWSIDDYRELLLVTGGKERIKAFIDQTGKSERVDIPAMHARKTEIYKELIDTGLVRLRPGIECMLKAARAKGLALAIATTTSRPNVEALFANTLGLETLDWFAAICCGDEVEKKKPDPAVYQLALDRLGLAGSACVAFEDSRAGLASAKGAGIDRVIITPSIYTADHDFAGATVLLRNLADASSWLELRSPNNPSSLPDPMPALLKDCASRPR